MSKCRVFYVITLKSGVKKKKLKQFLEEEWIPALTSAPGCLEVELLDDYQDRAGYCISEVWENQEKHLQNSTYLWSELKKDVWKEMGNYGIIEYSHNCIILSKTESNHK